jgi:GxxExxY protein
MCKDFPKADETYQILGACFEVYNEMGCGYLESVYQECLEHEFVSRKIPYVSQPSISLRFKGVQLESSYIPDFLCYASVIVELKAASRLSADHRAQLINYLKGSQIGVGLLVNFGSHPRLEYERVVNQKGRDRTVG